MLHLFRAPALIVLAFLLGKWVQGVRRSSFAPSSVVEWALGWTPSFVFAFGVTIGIVMLCVIFRRAWRSAVWCAAGALIGLCLREVWQLRSPSRTFDPWDLLALGLGGAAALALERRFYPEAVRPSATVTPAP